MDQYNKNQQGAMPGSSNTGWGGGWGTGGGNTAGGNNLTGQAGIDAIANKTLWG